MHFYSIIYKPFNVLSQFTTTDDKRTLKDFFDVPKDVYAVGRLDYDSEGLLILTNDKKLNHLLLDPSYNHKREYWAQVEGGVTQQAIRDLQNGVVISVDGKKYSTGKCEAALFKTAPVVPERYPPIRFRKNIPTTWIRLLIGEGKNRQVRKMTAAIGHPTLRLMRYSIEGLNIEGLMPGDMKILTQKDIYSNTIEKK